MSGVTGRPDPAAIFAPLDEFPRLGLAVSGGADSLALMLLAARYAHTPEARQRFFVYSVDHGLRPEARDEVAPQVPFNYTSNDGASGAAGAPDPFIYCASSSPAHPASNDSGLRQTARSPPAGRGSARRKPFGSAPVRVAQTALTLALAEAK